MNTHTIKESIDLRELAANYTTLRRESPKEMAGPCPKCGGSDRFHVQADSFFCRQCLPPENGKHYDAITFLRWLQDVSFTEAVTMLTGQAVPAKATVRQSEAKHRQPVQEWNETKAEQLLAGAQAALWDDANVLAHDYLEKERGLDPYTRLMFRLGYLHNAPLPGTWNAKSKKRSYPEQPAIVIPWFAGERLIGLRYRFLEKHTYTDIDGNERTEKQSALPGSSFAGYLFGGQVIERFPAPDDGGQDVLRLRTLVIAEGEMNAMSIWQVAHDTRLDVLSLGSESQKLTPAMIQYAERYRLVLLWADREQIAKQLMATIPGSIAVTSEMCQGQDANDLLRAGHLGGYLSAWRFHAAKDEQAQVVLFGDLEDGVCPRMGIDSGTRQVMEAIGQKLGKV